MEEMEQQTFNIEKGMAVYGDNAEFVGTVTEIAGFGSTRIDHLSDPVAARVTEAQSGTGYLRVEHAGRTVLHVPFHAVQSVIPGHGVTLTAAMIDKLRAAENLVAPGPDGTTQSQQRGENLTQPGRRTFALPRSWRVWKPSTWTLQPAAGGAATDPVDAQKET